MMRSAGAYATSDPLVLGEGEGGGGLAAALAGLPRVTAFRFSAVGTADIDNCCVLCRVPHPVTGALGPRPLGAGAGGRAANAMEIRFTLGGHRPGFEYDVLRTRRDSFWQRLGGAWTRLGAHPMGTWDDHHHGDECLTPRGGRIFVIDTPGWPVALPAAAGILWAGLTPPVPAPVSAAGATDVVLRFSFAEWVNGRSIPEGVHWTRLGLPARADGTPRRLVFWHSIIWLRRDGAGRWVLDPRSRVGRGSLSAATINSAPA